VDASVAPTRRRRGDAAALGLEHHLVDGALALRKGAAHGPSARDVRRPALGRFSADVGQEQIAGAGLGVVGALVQDLTGDGHDGAVGVVEPRFAQHADHGRVGGLLAGAGPRRAHPGQVGLGADRRGVSKLRDGGLVVLQPHGDDRLRERGIVAAQARPRRGCHRATDDRREPARGARVLWRDRRGAAELFHERRRFGHRSHRKAELGLDASVAGRGPMPQRVLRIVRWGEQREAVSIEQERRALEPRAQEVEEVARRSEGIDVGRVVSAGCRARRQNRGPRETLAAESLAEGGAAGREGGWFGHRALHAATLARRAGGHHRGAARHASSIANPPRRPGDRGRRLRRSEALR
jgi:hypothetical protein